MTNKITYIAAILIAFSLSLYAQQLKVEIIKLNLNSDYAHAKFIDEDELLLTKSNYSGLYIYSQSRKNLTQVTGETGAGYEAIVEAKTGKIFYRPYSLINGMKYFSLKSYDLKTGITDILIKERRELSVPRFNGKDVIVSSNNKITIFSSKSNNPSSEESDLKYAYVKDRKIIVNHAGIERSFNPLGGGVYVWASISPDMNSVVFTYGNKGTFIMDLNGNIISEIGLANYPSFSPDGKYLLYMKDYDDGERYLSSDIYIRDLQSNKEYIITNAPEEIEMYPSWSANGKQICFHDLKGNVYIAKILFNK